MDKKNMIGLLAALAVLAAALFILWRQQSGVAEVRTPGQATTAGATGTPAAAEEWETYRDSMHGFSVSYPRELMAHNGEGNLIDRSGREIQGLKLSRMLRGPDCGESGMPEHCRAFVENPSIGFYVVEGGVQMHASSARAFLGDLVREATIAGRSGYEIELGAEGRGLITYYLPLTADTTLVITRSVIDESAFGSGYMKGTDFLPLAKQRELFEQVIATLTFS